MNKKPTIITERVDDIPLLLAQMDRVGLAEVLDAHFPTHGNWQGLSFGRVTTIWLSSILSRGDHRLVHVEPWVAQRQMMLSQITGGAVRAHECSDDRLAIVLRLLSDDQGWVSFESALNQHLVRVYDLQADRVHVDSTSASAYASVSDEGLFQFGHSKDHRPDLPQVKVMQAVLDPLGMLLATDVVSGERVIGPLYVPYIERVQASLGRSDLLYVGDCKMASRQTRAWIAGQGVYYLCPLSQVQLSKGGWKRRSSLPCGLTSSSEWCIASPTTANLNVLPKATSVRCPWHSKGRVRASGGWSVASWCRPCVMPRPQRRPFAPAWRKRKWKRSINAAEVANALKTWTTCVKPFRDWDCRALCGQSQSRNGAAHSRSLARSV